MNIPAHRSIPAHIPIIQVQLFKYIQVTTLQLSTPKMSKYHLLIITQNLKLKHLKLHLN